MTKLPLTILIVLNLVAGKPALDLEKLVSLGIKYDFYVSDIVIYFNRAFLAIPRTLCRNNVTHPTLVEVPWKEFNVILISRFTKPIEGQIWAKCEDLQNAVSLAKEGVKSKLWILDRGNEFCPPKIAAYSMFQNSFLEGEVIELAEVPKDELSSMVIENGTKFGNHRAFIASAGDNAILVCYLDGLKCDHLKLLEKNNPAMVISVVYISISKVGSTMYFTGAESLGVFSLEMENLMDTENNIENGTAVNVTLCGDKLGPSSGLETDLKNGLIYYLVRDYAVVRWTTSKPLQAEYHDVLAQSYKRMPYVSRIFTDPQGGVYALINPFSPKSCSNEDSASFQDDKIKALERAVKVMKYNRLLDMLF